MYVPTINANSIRHYSGPLLSHLIVIIATCVRYYFNGVFAERRTKTRFLKVKVAVRGRPHEGKRKKKKQRFLSVILFKYAISFSFGVSEVYWIGT